MSYHPSDNLPPGVSPEMIDRQAGKDEDTDED